MSTTQAVTAAAANVRAELARRQITARKLAEITGRDGTYWSRRLNGQRPMSLEDLEQVAEITGVPIERLVA